MTNLYIYTSELIAMNPVKVKKDLDDLRSQFKQLPDDDDEALYQFMSVNFAQFARDTMSGGDPAIDMARVWDEDGNPVYRDLKIQINGVALNMDEETVFITALGNITVKR